MEELPAELRVRNAVDRVADNGQVDRGQVNPDLMHPAGLQADRKQSMARQQPLELEMGDRLARRIRVQRLTESVVTVTAERRLDPAASRARPAADERQVAAVEQSLADEILKPAVGLLGPGDDKESRRVAVEAVDDARPLRDVPPGDPSREERLHERPARVARRGMDDDPGRLVDDEQVLVLVGDPQLALLGLEGDVVPLLDVHFQQLSALEPVALLARLTVQAHRPGGEQALGFAARGDLGQCCNEPVEPLAGGVGRNANAQRASR